MDPKFEALGYKINLSETKGNEQELSLYSFTV
jgi:hypothetical protein